MPQSERGLYEPGEDVRVFDAADEEEDVEGSRLPLLIVLALLVLAMFAGFVWLAYSEGVARGRSEIPVVAAESGPARVAPANPGGASTPYKGFKIYEQPAPPDEDTAQDVSPRAPTEAKPAPAPAPAAPKAAAMAPAAPVKPSPAAKVEAPPAKQVAPPVKAAAAPAPKPAAAAKTVAPEPKAASSAPTQSSAPLAPATAPPQKLAANVAPPPAAKPAPAAPASAPGAYVLQIGAYKSQAEADAAWNVYKAKHAALLAGYSPDVARADLGDKGTWYRLRIAGFSSKDVASALCDRLKADGGGCFLGK